MAILRSLLIITLLFNVSSFAQTYDVLKVEITCQAKPLTSQLNTSANEFSPYFFEDVLYFSSDRDPDYFLGGENNWSSVKCINLFQTEVKGDINETSKYKNTRLVSEKLNIGTHTGPACLSTTGDTLFLSQVKVDKKSGVFKPQIYICTRENNTFSTPKLLPFNDPNFSFTHPAYNSAEQRLYFSSDKSGGAGGKDLYSTQLTDAGWSTPTPITEANTSEDEVFPFVVENILFYASNQNGKANGLDIFWELLDGISNRQPLEGLNSPKDDFGLYVFSEMKNGYFTTNRNGNDDISFLDMSKTVTISKEMAGTFKFKNLNTIPSNMTVQIVGENDFIVQETTTDENGDFVFRQLDYNKEYSIKALSDEDLELSLKNQEGVYVADLLGDKNNVFTYRKIGADNSGTLSLIPEDMIDFALNEGHLSAQLIYEDKVGVYPKGIKVMLVDEKGNTAMSTLTDEKGNFDFKKISMSTDYVLKTQETDDRMVLLIYDLKGNVVAQLKTNEKGEFTYRKLNPNYSNTLEIQETDEDAFEYDSQTIWGYFEYNTNKKLNREGLIVSAYNENGDLVASEITDKEGLFRFRNLPIDRTLMFQLKENGENFILDNFTLYIYDRYGQKIAGLRRGQDGYFTYRPLGYDKSADLNEIEAENLEFILGDQLKRQRIMVYFDSNQEQVKSEELKILNNLVSLLKSNPAIKVEINAYADAKATDEYNLVLSLKRGEWIRDYFTKKGIAANRIIINSYGESRLIDEKNDALNRRAEIHLY
ncbi:MAG: OmpA family protein [Crocinitomix sp.]|nr:OmpA family protein [Crocinitomix sp.]